MNWVKGIKCVHANFKNEEKRRFYLIYLFTSLDTINIEINHDRHQLIHSFFKTPKMQLTSEQRIFVVTNDLRTRSSKEVRQLSE